MTKEINIPYFNNDSVKYLNQWLRNFNSTYGTQYAAVYDFDKGIGTFLAHKLDVHFVEAFILKFKMPFTIVHSIQFSKLGLQFYLLTMVTTTNFDISKMRLIQLVTATDTKGWQYYPNLVDGQYLVNGSKMEQVNGVQNYYTDNQNYL